MRRVAVAIVTVLLFAAAILLEWLGPQMHSQASICARVGFVMAALWLALPSDGGKVNWWLVGLVAAVMLGFARLPRSMKLLAIGSLPLLLALLWPRKRRKEQR